MESLTTDEQIIFDAIVAARDVQEFIWGGQTLSNNDNFNNRLWAQVFQKRVEKIKEIDFEHPSALIELRKRVLQQAALSIAGLQLLEKISNPKKH